MNYFFLVLARLFFSFANGVGSHLNFSLGNILFLGFLVPALAGLYVYALTSLAGFSFWVSFLFALLAVAALSIIYALFFRRLSAEAFTIWGFSSFLAFVALLESWTSVTRGNLGLTQIPFPSFLNGLDSMAIGGVMLGSIALLLEFCFLNSPYGRALRAYKESSKVLSSLGYPSLFLAQCVLFCFPFLIFFSGFLWISYLKFLTPSTLATGLIVESLSLSVLALKPHVRSVIGASLFVFCAPELLRFFHFSETTFGHIRVLFYSSLLLILLLVFRKKLSFSKRII